MREATLEDSEAIEALEGLLFDNAFGTKTIEAELKHGQGFVIEQDGELVAYLLARRDNDLVDITRLGVHPQHQRRGHGSRLLRKALGLAHNAMLTVRKHNEPALQLYLQTGFQIVAHTPASWLLGRITSAE